MSYVTALTDGPNTLSQNTVYAMPGKSKMVLASDVLAVCNTTGGTFANVAATTTSGAVIPGASFVKCTTSTCTAVLTNQ